MLRSIILLTYQITFGNFQLVLLDQSIIISPSSICFLSLFLFHLASMKKKKLQQIILDTFTIQLAQFLCTIQNTRTQWSVPLTELSIACLQRPLSIPPFYILISRKRGRNNRHGCIAGERDATTL